MTHGWILVLGSVAAFAQQAPPIRNTKVETRSASAGLESTLGQIVQGASPGPVWVGYTVPAVPWQRETCWNGDYAATVHLEGPKEFYILYRISEQKIQRVQIFSPDCVLDGGNASFYWLTDVKPAESVAFLATLQWDGAMTALAIHAAPEATRTLLDLARNSSKPHTRGQALVWLARTAPFQVSEPVIRDAIEKAPEAEVKRRAVFALSQVPEGRGVPLLIQLARDSRNVLVQKQAMFWLGRSKDERAIRFFAEVLSR